LDIRRAVKSDSERIAEIYNWYVLNTIVTFETAAVSPEDMKQRIQEKLARYDWIVGECDQQVIGYAYYDSFRVRTAYDHTVETTIYLSRESIGKGFGTKLYSTLLDSAIRHGFREAVGVIALPNPASLVLHQTLGFHEVGVLQSVGYKFGQYVDVGIWQRSLQTH
jgi:L-amino acid N-acyltransferase YncA